MPDSDTEPDLPELLHPRCAAAVEHLLVRIAELEIARNASDAWQVRLREDVGSAEECQAVRQSSMTVRAVQRRAKAAVLSAALAVGGSGYGLLKSRDENIAANVRAQARIERLEQDVARNRDDIRALRWPFDPAPVTPKEPP